jgi:hypothetical protein
MMKKQRAESGLVAPDEALDVYVTLDANFPHVSQDNLLLRVVNEGEK